MYMLVCSETKSSAFRSRHSILEGDGLCTMIVTTLLIPLGNWLDALLMHVIRCEAVLHALYPSSAIHWRSTSGPWTDYWSEPPCHRQTWRDNICGSICALCGILWLCGTSVPMGAQHVDALDAVAGRLWPRVVDLKSESKSASTFIF